MKMPIKWYVAATLLIALLSLSTWFLLPNKSPLPTVSATGSVQQSNPNVPTPRKLQSLAFMVRESADVRLFVAGLPFKEPADTQKLMANDEGISLNDRQRIVLAQSIQKRRATQEDIANQPGCFDPHHFFRFYDRKGQMIAELSVCYCCGGARLGGSSAAKIMGDADFIDFDFAAVKEMLISMKVPTNINCRDNARY